MFVIPRTLLYRGSLNRGSTVFQRARLVLAAKGIEYERVNINLKDKPEWFLELNPLGKVPVIEHPDGKVIYESAICCGRYYYHDVEINTNSSP